MRDQDIDSYTYYTLPGILSTYIVILLSFSTSKSMITQLHRNLHIHPDSQMLIPSCTLYDAIAS